MGSDKYQPPGPLFVGNFDYEAHPRDVEKLIDRYGDVERIDMKMADLERCTTANIVPANTFKSSVLHPSYALSFTATRGFAFVYMYDKRDGDDAIKALDGTEWGDRKRRRLKVEWARGDGEVKRREEQRRKQQAPTSTLFVVNFDVTRVRESDLAHEFNKYGRTKRVQIKKNFAFIQYDTVEDAERALKGTHLTDIGGRTISVEYVAREADGRRPWEQPARETSYDRRSDRGGGGSSRRSLSPRRRSPSRTPPRRRSPSPDYGRRSAGRDGSLDRSRDRSRTPRRDVGRDRSRTPPSRRSPRRSPPRSP